MYKFAITGDTHLKLGHKGLQNTETHLPLKLEKDLELLYNITDYCEEHNIKTFIHTGDLADKPNPTEKLKRYVLEWIQYTIDKKIRLIVLGGNHSTEDNIVFNFMSDPLLDSTNLFRVITDHQLVKLDDKHHLLFTAWNQNKLITEYQPTAPTVLFGHLEMQGAYYDSEIRSEAELHPRTLSKFEHAFFGHYHKRQEHQYYTYVGATNRHTFGERKNDVGFSIMEWDEEVQETFIPQEGTQYIQIEIEAETPETSVQKFLDNTDVGESFVKIQSTIPRSQSMTFPTNALEKMVYDAGAWYCTVDKDYVDDVQEQVIEQNLSEMEIFEKFIASRELDSYYTSIGKQLLQDYQLGE